MGQASERWGSCLDAETLEMDGVQSQELDSGLSSGAVLHGERVSSPTVGLKARAQPWSRFRKGESMGTWGGCSRHLSVQQETASQGAGG